ncbi:MAG: hypothetical protein ED556_13140 [Winogradskyella sp.]|uniref:hypothetical protein n=1 Tax=Winogradskyella sp. TaxID=1883156 RepID=UPI000F3C5B10|nr:hypothetical protein [Winogradskyella sp.]RNC83496.1 MAG: hypothetical protein ED556_13140 [Winogradskyella sp.]
MLRKVAILLIILSIGFKGFTQENINAYKYVVVPLKFEFLKGKDAYRTSTLTRYLLKKEGFEVYFDEEKLPQELFDDRCLALYANVLKVSGGLSIKVQVQLNDCYGNEVFLSDIGKTKIKMFKEAYPAAIKDAFKSVEFLQYEYDPSIRVTNSVDESEKDVLAKLEAAKKKAEDAEKAKAELAQLKKEVEDLKKQKEAAEKKAEDVVAEEIVAPQEEAPKEDVIEKEVLVAKAEKPIEKEIIAKETMVVKEPVSKPKSSTQNILYAQPLDNGYQLVDASPKIVMVLIKTAAPNVYTVKGKDAIVFKEDGKWFYSENSDKKELNIKF